MFYMVVQWHFSGEMENFKTLYAEVIHNSVHHDFHLWCWKVKFRTFYSILRRICSILVHFCCPIFVSDQYLMQLLYVPIVAKWYFFCGIFYQMVLFLVAFFFRGIFSGGIFPDIRKITQSSGEPEKRAFYFKGVLCMCNVLMPYCFMTVYQPNTALTEWLYSILYFLILKLPSDYIYRG